MSNDCTLILKGKINPQDGMMLKAFCEDWRFIKKLEQVPVASYLAETYRECEVLFQDLTNDDVKKLARGTLHVRYEGKFPRNAVEVMVHKFLPRALIRLDTFRCEIPEQDARWHYIFNAETNALEEHKGLGGKSRLTPKEATHAWRERYGAMSSVSWRTGLRHVIQFIATGMSDHPEIHTLEEACHYYLDRLNLRAELRWAAYEMYLTNGECRKLEKFDEALRNIKPGDPAPPELVAAARGIDPSFPS